MTKKIISLIAAFMLCYTPLASAETTKIQQPEHQVIERIEDHVGIIDIIGEINADTLKTVDAGFANFRKEHVIQIIIHLNSLGGSYSVGKSIIEDMLDAEGTGLDVVTYVDHQETCAAMCTTIYAAGSTRMAPIDTIWIFRAPAAKLSDADKNNPQLKDQTNAAIEAGKKYMMQIYDLADPDWAESTLKDHIMQSDNELVLTGKDIVAQKNLWINIVISD